MNLEDQVCSFELAKRLKELGMKQDSYFEYLFMPYYYEWKVSSVYKVQLGISAFTVAELIDLLPECIPHEGDLMIANYMDMDSRRYMVDYAGAGIKHFTSKSLADACALMLIYLIEKELVHV